MSGRRLFAIVAATLSAGFAAAGCLPPQPGFANQVLATSVAVPPPAPTLGVGRILGEDRTVEVRAGGLASLGPGHSSSAMPALLAPAAGGQLEVAVRIAKVLLSLGGTFGIVSQRAAPSGVQAPRGVPFDVTARLQGQTFGRDDWDLGWEIDLYGEDGVYHFPPSSTVDFQGNNLAIPDTNGDAFALEVGGGLTPEVRVGPIRLLAGLYLRTMENGDQREQHYYSPPSDSAGTAVVGTARAGVEVPMGRSERASLLLDGYASAGFPQVLTTFGTRLGLLLRF